MLLGLVTAMAIRKERWSSFQRKSYRLVDEVFLKSWCVCYWYRKRAVLVEYEKILIGGMGSTEWGRSEIEDRSGKNDRIRGREKTWSSTWVSGSIRQEAMVDTSSVDTDDRNDDIAKGRFGFGMEDSGDFDEGGCHVRSAVGQAQHAWHG